MTSMPRTKPNNSERAKLKVEDADRDILFKKVPSTIDLIGSGSKRASVEEMNELLDQMRAEETS